jgi:hypothetical protein
LKIHGCDSVDNLDENKIKNDTDYIFWKFKWRLYNNNTKSSNFQNDFLNNNNSNNNNTANYSLQNKNNNNNFFDDNKFPFSFSNTSSSINSKKK